MLDTLSPERPRPGPPALDALFRPRAIAILGASGRADNPFARPLRYLVEYGFTGPVYPINPGYETLDGQTCFPSLADLPGPVDLVLLMVSAAESVRQLPAVAAAGATAAIVFASGFAEIGPDGLALQQELTRVAAELGIRVLGPNCQGLVGFHDGVVASFTAALESGLPEPGGIAYVGQSGAVGGSILSLARERGLRIGAWASTGNQADLTAVEIAAGLVEDERLQVITLYLESPADGADFDLLTRRAQELGKSVVVLQSALSAPGARAAASHTGAMIGSNAAFVARCEERGVVRADDVDSFIAIAHALSVLPRRTGRRIGIVTTSGGAGSLAADQADRAGLSVPTLSVATQERLAEVVPDFGAVSNPVDVTAQLFRAGRTDDFRSVCEQVLADPDIDAVLVALTMVTGDLADSMVQELQALWVAADKPLVVVWLAARQQTEAAREVLRAAGWPLSDSPRAAVEVLGALLAGPGAPSVDPVPADPDGTVGGVLAGLAGTVTEGGGAALLDAAGVARPRQLLGTDPVAATAFAEELAGPAVLKIQAPGVVHKTDRGGVLLDVPADRVAGQLDALLERFAGESGAKVLLQEQLPAGPELLVGVTRSEPGYPALLTVALGGVLTELYADRASALVPVDADRAVELIRTLRAAPLLTGYRGSAPIDLTAAGAAVAAISRVAEVAGERLVELEINPLRLVDGGARAVALDILLQLDDTPTGPTARDGRTS